MCVLTIPDDLLREAGLSEKDALVELACRLFDAGKLTLHSAARLAGLDRGQMEDALLERSMPIFRPSAAEVADDLANLKDLEI